MKKRFLSLLLYWLFFSFVFSVFLIENVLPGATDSLGHIVILYDHLTNLHILFSESKWGYTLYQEQGTEAYSESYLFQALVYMSFRLVGVGDVWSSWILIVMLFTFNALAVFKLSEHYTRNFWAALVSGLCFSASAFMLGNIELLNSLGFFPVPISVLVLEKYCESGKRSEFVMRIVILAVAHFVSAYALLFALLLWWTLIFQWRRPKLPSIREVMLYHPEEHSTNTTPRTFISAYSNSVYS